MFDKLTQMSSLGGWKRNGIKSLNVMKWKFLFQQILNNSEVFIKHWIYENREFQFFSLRMC